MLAWLAWNLWIKGIHPAMFVYLWCLGNEGLSYIPGLCHVFKFASKGKVYSNILTCLCSENL